MNDDTTSVALPRGRTALLEAIVDHLPAMVAYWDRSLRNVFANSAYTELVGMTPAQMHGLHASEVFGADDVAMTTAYTDAALLGVPQNFERVIVDHSGASRSISASYIPDVVGGSVIGLFALGTDISELVRAKHAEQRGVEEVAKMAERARIADGVHAEVLQLLFAATLELTRQAGPHSETALAQISKAVEELRRLLDVAAP